MMMLLIRGDDTKPKRWDSAASSMFSRAFSTSHSSVAGKRFSGSGLAGPVVV